MIKFKKLKLKGFKSFVEPTEIIIEQGLTGIVGPNGCWKSNLVEAFRFVMGELAPKQMRGSELDDVIDHFKKAGLPYSTNSATNNKLYKAIISDKKNTNNKINLILLKKVGEAYYKRGVNITTL